MDDLFRQLMESGEDYQKRKLQNQKEMEEFRKNNPELLEQFIISDEGTSYTITDDD
ncbi:unknown [Fusobacterium sp. CAG:439]|nr:unknown [Fusobacterium sp. CAG:439]